MKLSNKYATDLTSKDKNVAIEAAKHIINNADIDAWKCFVESSDNIYDFIKQNIAKYFAQVIDENNYKNLFELFKIHSFDWDECFIQILLRFSYSNQSLHEKMLELIEKGSEDEKAYAAKYFSFIPDNKANYFLFEAYSVNYEPLKYNSAKALGDACDLYSYNYYINKLASDDDWDKIDAAQFLQWYGNKKAFIPMINALKTSSMPEHIAGSVAMLDDISHYFNADDMQLRDLALDCYQLLIESLAEIWPLSTIIDFDLYDCVEVLIKIVNQNIIEDKSRLCALILKTRYQFEKFNSDEYKFNEDKRTLEAMDNIQELFNEASMDFWKTCTNALSKELEQQNEDRVRLALNVIVDFKFNAFVQKIKEMINKSFSENLIYEIILTLSEFDDFYGINKNQVLEKVKDYNLQIAIDKMIK